MTHARPPKRTHAGRKVLARDLRLEPRARSRDQGHHRAMQLPPSVPLAMALGSGMCAAVATSSPAEIGSYKRRPTLDSFRSRSPPGSSRSRTVARPVSAPPPRPPDTPSPAMERWQTARERVGSAPTRRRLRSPKSARVTSKSPLLAVLPEGTVVTAAIERARLHGWSLVYVQALLRARLPAHASRTHLMPRLHLQPS